jgi:pyruvate/2-oxoglutarate dehydrogenase complex dihydrolipoamide acyltransferase (E2) component
MNATVGGQSLLPNTTIFSGDSLQVRDGVAVVAVGNSSRMVFGRDTVASFLRDANEVTVLLSQGNVSMFHPNEGTSVRVKAGGVSVVPAAGFKTLGEVAMLNGSVVISAKEGSLQVNDRGTTKNVVKGQTIVIAPKTADTKVGGGGGSNEDNWLDIGGIAAGGVAAVLAGIAISRANGAKTSADAATTAAQAATAAANTANTTAGNAVTAAQAATAAAQQAAFEAGCTYNAVTTGLPDSPYTPPAGQPCPYPGYLIYGD